LNGYIVPSSYIVISYLLFDVARGPTIPAFKGALNPNFLNLTKYKEKFCL